jgi:hypothetical protein
MKDSIYIIGHEIEWCEENKIANDEFQEGFIKGLEQAKFLIEHIPTYAIGMKRIYVAGAYSANNVITVLDNMRKGMRLSTEVMLAGFAPFSPWLDYHFQLMLRGDEKLTVKQYYEYSKAWLEVSDGMILVPGYENSVGTMGEIELANKIDIPIFFTLEQMIYYYK